MSKYANYHRQSTSSGKVMHQRLRVTVVGFGWYCNIIYKWTLMNNYGTSSSEWCFNAIPGKVVATIQPYKVPVLTESTEWTSSLADIKGLNNKFYCYYEIHNLNKM